jgi:hypothetical protein
MHLRNGLRRSTHFDLRSGLATKDVEQELARQTADSRCRLPHYSRKPLVGFSPLDVEPARVQPPAQIATAAANVAPQGDIHCRREATGPPPVRPANVLVMNEELVEVRQGSDRSEAEEPDRRARPDPRDETREILAPSQTRPTPFGEALEGTGQNQAGAGDQIALPQHEVGGEIVSRPALQQCRGRRAELVEQIAELEALLRIQRGIDVAGCQRTSTASAGEPVDVDDFTAIDADPIAPIEVGA